MALRYGEAEHKLAFELWLIERSLGKVAQKDEMPGKTTLSKWSQPDFDCPVDCKWHDWNALEKQMRRQAAKRVASQGGQLGEQSSGQSGQNQSEEKEVENVEEAQGAQAQEDSALELKPSDLGPELESYFTAQETRVQIKRLLESQAVKHLKEGKHLTPKELETINKLFDELWAYQEYEKSKMVIEDPAEVNYGDRLLEGFKELPKEERLVVLRLIRRASGAA